MGWQLVQLYESVGVRDLVEIVILAVAIYALLRLLGRTRGSGLVRGLGLVVVVAFLAAEGQPLGRHGGRYYRAPGNEHDTPPNA